MQEKIAAGISRNHKLREHKQLNALVICHVYCINDPIRIVFRVCKMNPRGKCTDLEKSVYHTDLRSFCQPDYTIVLL